VVVTTPVPRSRHRFWRCRNRWMTLSRHPGHCAGPLPSWAVRPTRDILSLDAPADGITRRPSLRVRPPFTRPCPPFLERVCRAYSRPEVACRLLQLNHDVRANQPGLLILAGTEASTSFLFFDASRPLPCGSGDARRAAQRPNVQPQCWFLPLAWVCPTVMPERSPHHEDAFDAIVCSEDRRARVEGPSEGRVCRAHATISRACVGCMSFVAHARRRSPPRRPSGHPPSSARRCRGGIPTADDGPI